MQVGAAGDFVWHFIEISRRFTLIALKVRVDFILEYKNYLTLFSHIWEAA